MSEVLTTNLLSCESTSWGANATIKRAIIQIIGGSDFANKRSVVEDWLEIQPAPNESS